MKRIIMIKLSARSVARVDGLVIANFHAFLRATLPKALMLT
jgi:hypothetical protein